MNEHSVDDAILRAARDARDAPSVHKAALMAMRGNGVRGYIFVCEGVDDKKVYYHWLKLLRISSEYEFFVCNGKKQVLRLRELLVRDLSGLSEGVFYFLDRDFDGLIGFSCGEEVYVTESYSIENDLVSAAVLDAVLAVDMHCNGLPNVRSKIVERFESVYSKFLEISKPHNQRLHLARTLNIPVKPLSDKLSKVAVVKLLDVEPSSVAIEDVVNLEVEPNEIEKTVCAKQFIGLDPRSNYRGKYALSFFLRWLELLADDRRSNCGVLFSGVPRSSSNANGSFSIESLSSKSYPPSSFCQFIEKIQIGSHAC